MARNELVGKLSPKQLGWDRVELGMATKELRASEKVHLGRIVGIITGLRESVDKETGDINAGLKGQFRGVSTKMVDGEPITVTSGVCYLPSGLQAMLEGELAQAKENDARANVRFAIDLFALKDENKAGYTFKADNIVEAEADDPLATLFEQADANASTALPAPSGKADTKASDNAKEKATA